MIPRSSRKRAARTGLVAGASVLALLLGLARADEVVTKDGKKLEGRIDSEDEKTLSMHTYKDGPITLDLDKIKSKTRKPNLYEDFDKKFQDVEQTADGFFKLAEWCKSKGLLWQATKEYELTIALDREHEKAHKALGHEKYNGEWKTHEDVMRAKGMELFEGKWIDSKKAEQIRESRRVGWVLTAAGKGIDADKAFLEAWGERAREGSRFMWLMSQGQMYVKEITLYPKTEGKVCDYSIINKDSNMINATTFAQTDGSTITAPGKIKDYTFLHELIHLKYGRPHCDNCKPCVMSNDPGLKKKATICDDGDHQAPPATSCWAAIRAYHLGKGVALKPLVRTNEPELPECPPTNVIIKMD